MAGAEGAQNRVRDEKIESRAFAPIVCAWCGGDTGKLSGRKIRTWARDTGCAVRAAYRGEGACAGRASTSRGAAYIRSRVPCALSRFQRSDAGILSMSDRPAVAPRAPSDGLPRRSVHLFRCAPQLLIPVAQNSALERATFLWWRPTRLNPARPPDEPLSDRCPHGDAPSATRLPRRNSTLSESSESFIWRARGVQAGRAPPEEGRALERGVLRNGNEELGRAPVASGAARSSGGSALILACAKLQRRFGRGQLVAPDSVSAVSCSYPASRGAES